MGLITRPAMANSNGCWTEIDDATPAPNERQPGLNARRFTSIQAQDTRFRAFSCPNSPASADGPAREKPPACSEISGWRDPDSNRGHHDFQSCALPTELSRRAANRLARGGPGLELRQRVDRLGFLRRVPAVGPDLEVQVRARRGARVAHLGKGLAGGERRALAGRDRAGLEVHEH